MSQHSCPKCSEKGFTWFIDEEVTPLTQWGCSNCGYSAIEDESYEKVCDNCVEKTKSRLQDKNETYWWCCKCDKTWSID